MEKISIFNYEAFYLDFLEGNLNEADTALFLNFLDENPDLKMDEELLLSFEKTSVVLDPITKAGLKQPEENEALTLLNIEHFLIAQAENDLSLQKSAEVDAFVAGDTALEETKAVLNAVYFEADKSIIFADKQSLKRKKAIVLWPYYTAAASVLVALLVWYSNSNGKIIGNDQLYADDQIETVLENKKEDGSSVLDNDKGIASPKVIQNIKENNGLPIANYRIKENKVQPEVKKDPKESTHDLKNAPKKNKKPRVKSIEDIKLEPVSNNNSLVASVELPKDLHGDYADKYFSDVENPIEPLTSFIGTKTNTKIDFRREKKTKKKPSSLFIKVGKFEFSRKKH